MAKNNNVEVKFILTFGRTENECKRMQFFKNVIKRTDYIAYQ